MTDKKREGHVAFVVFAVKVKDEKAQDEDPLGFLENLLALIRGVVESFRIEVNDFSLEIVVLGGETAGVLGCEVPIRLAKIHDDVVDRLVVGEQRMREPMIGVGREQCGKSHSSVLGRGHLVPRTQASFDLGGGELLFLFDLWS